MDMLSDFLCSIFDGFVGVLLAGFFIWRFQQNYQNNAARLSKTEEMYVMRRRNIEEDFYRQVQRARSSFYELNMILTNTNVDLDTNTVLSIVGELQKAYDMIMLSPVVLSSYKTEVDMIHSKYNEFSNVYAMGRKRISDYIDEKRRMGQLGDDMFQQFDNIDLTDEENRMGQLRDDIFQQFDNIDLIYLGEKRVTSL